MSWADVPGSRWGLWRGVCVHVEIDRPMRYPFEQRSARLASAGGQQFGILSIV